MYAKQKANIDLENHCVEGTRIGALKYGASFVTSPPSPTFTTTKHPRTQHSTLSKIVKSFVMTYDGILG